MRVKYIGPLAEGMGHPALEGYDLSRFAPSCYLVEVSEEAGVDGSLVIEGDVLVVDEARMARSEDLVIVGRVGQQRLYRTRLIFTFIRGRQMQLVELIGGSPCLARLDEVRGVVISQMRRYVA